MTGPSTPKFKRSHEMLARAERTIPLGSQTFSKSHIQFPQGHAPLFLERGEGALVWDVDGNRYVDAISGLLSLLLGYRDPEVDAAILAQLDRGISFSLATDLEAEVAERLVANFPSAEMVRFGKNGTDATSAAIRLARAHTGKTLVAVSGYHGWQDWYIGSTVRNLGVPSQVSALTKTFPFGNVDALAALLATQPGEFAAVIMEPCSALEPPDGYLSDVKSLAHRHGALLIFDEVITGLRVSSGGAQAYYDVTPDLTAIGKALGNGMPISAIVGRADVMSLMSEVFYSGTFGGETLSLAAARAVLDKIDSAPVISHLWETGQAIRDGFMTHAHAAGLSDIVALMGLPPWLILRWEDHASASREAIRTFFLREMLANGVLINGSFNVSYAYDEACIRQTLAATEVALHRLADELRMGRLLETLDCPPIVPVFSVRK